MRSSDASGREPVRFGGGLSTKLLLGNGTLKPKLRAALESEGVVLLEEGLPGTITYAHFKAPGRRYHGKVVGECFASD